MQTVYQCSGRLCGRASMRFAAARQQAGATAFAARRTRRAISSGRSLVCEVSESGQALESRRGHQCPHAFGFARRDRTIVLARDQHELRCQPWQLAFKRTQVPVRHHLERGTHVARIPDEACIEVDAVRIER